MKTTNTTASTVEETVKNDSTNLTPLSRELEIEMNAKNRAYSFILSNGLLSKFTEFLSTDNNMCDTREARIARAVDGIVAPESSTIEETTQETKETTVPVPAPDFIDSFASSFVEVDKDYRFGSMSDRELFYAQVGQFAELVDYLSLFSVRLKITALSRLAACYAKHSTHNPSVQNDTLRAVDHISELLEELSAYSENLDTWSVFLRMLRDRLGDMG